MPSADVRRFRWTLAILVGAALGVRVAWVLISRVDISFGGDAYFYNSGANLLAQGHGFISPFFYRVGLSVQAADHPPLYLLFLSIPSVLGMTSTATHLLWSCALGTATVVVVGLLGRTVLSPRVGIIAATFAAFYPNLWIPDGSLEAETAAIFTTALSVLLAYRYLQRPSWQRLGALSATCGLAALARSELILLLPFLVGPVALWTHDGRSMRQRLRWLGIATLATVVVVGPWIGYNLTRFKHPVYLSSQFDALLASANCNSTYYGAYLGYFSIPCTTAYARQYHVHGDESEQAIGYHQAALDYIDAHKGRVPIVVAARVGRILELYRPRQNLTFLEYLSRIGKPLARAALISYYALAILSIVGGFILRRRRQTVYPLLIPIAIVLMTVVVTYASSRFRAPAEVMLTVLAAVAVDAAATSLMSGHDRGRPRALLNVDETATGISDS